MVVFAHYPAGETRVQRQTEALINHGFEVDILCLRVMQTGTEPAEEVVNGANVYRLPSTRSYGKTGLAQQLLEYLSFFFQAMMALIRLYPRRRWQVVQLHNLPDFLVFAGWYPKLRGAKLILDLHDLMPEFFAGRHETVMNSWIVRLVALQERLSCRFANHVITVTDLWKQTLADRSVRADKISVVMNVADHRIFRRNGTGNGASAEKSDDDLHLFYHGAIVERYGLDQVLKAVAELRNELPGLRFTIHGNSDYQPELVALSNQLNLNDRVTFSTKMLPIAELPELIKTADVGLVPYKRDIFTDGILPTKLMEYTALGIPSIVARTPAIESYFDETMVEFFTSENLEELSQAIRRLYHDRKRLKQLAEKADRFNTEHGWVKESEDYVKLVTELGGRPWPTK
ncbi:MAG: glycosyltransferase family 4 protein [Anaerolineae bacterium]|nr:glycosyltransferase family 4 protein [Anaerolineae bacterium]